jgi:thymidylate synthase (FAD)
LEHIVFSFDISGISRACSHQLVRHRMASYSQRSQRYVNESEFEYVIPDSLNESADALVSYWSCMSDITSIYNHLIDLGIPKEDARFVLPNACETSLVMTINARSLRNFFKLRMDKHAQWEIRELAMEMYNQIKNEYGILFEDVMEGLKSAN